MADVRSMLKASREARRINHPYASYTSDGKLLCSLCEKIIKTEGAWQGHLHSTEHIARQTRAQEAADARGKNVAAGSKKRKADASPEAAKKKTKADVISIGVDEEDEEQEQSVLNGKKSKPDKRSKQQLEEDEKPSDPNELAAFERQLLEMEASMPKAPSRRAEPTISAPAMTAEEVAAQAREEQSTQREKRTAEQEAEKEDAARVLEDEFEEMEGLEERARKLRERREELRKGVHGASAGAEPPIEAPLEANGTVGQDAEDEDDEEDDEEDFDDWNFGAR